MGGRCEMSVGDAASFAVAFAAFAALGISLRQSRIMADQQRAAIRPFLRPGPAMVDDTPNFHMEQGYPIRLLNVGVGPAFNVSGCLYPPRPQPGQQVDGKGIAFYQLLAIDVFRGNLADRSSTDHPMIPLSEGIMLPGERAIDGRGRFTLFGPPSQFTEGQYVIPTRTPVLARLTLTYQDVEGRKHAAIFDYLERHGWRQITYLHNVPHTLDELNATYTHDTLHALVVK